MATRRANHAATASPATAKRGRLSERAWSDVLRAARIARAEGVALRVHGCAQPGRNPQARKLLEGSDSAILACAGQAGVGRLFASSKGTCQRCKQYKNLRY